ncbi:Hypothetical protein (Fragment) [Durusdinium trenchii]|uniref:Uncharacterized protein n=1 Tax=Durusdinium trenchii TaxID=1381693 RepID=A0ABP0IFQ6_9DINO
MDFVLRGADGSCERIHRALGASASELVALAVRLGKSQINCEKNKLMDAFALSKVKQFLYLKQLECETFQQAVQMVAVAQALKMASLRSAAINQVCSLATDDNALAALELSRKFGTTEDVEQVSQQIVAHFPRVMLSKAWKAAPFDLVAPWLEHAKVIMLHPLHTVYGLMRWILGSRKAIPANDERLNRVLSAIAANLVLDSKAWEMCRASIALEMRKTDRSAPRNQVLAKLRKACLVASRQTRDPWTSLVAVASRQQELQAVTATTPMTTAPQASKIATTTSSSSSSSSSNPMRPATSSTQNQISPGSTEWTSPPELAAVHTASPPRPNEAPSWAQVGKLCPPRHGLSMVTQNFVLSEVFAVGGIVEDVVAAATRPTMERCALFGLKSSAESVVVPARTGPQVGAQTFVDTLVLPLPRHEGFCVIGGLNLVCGEVTARASVFSLGIWTDLPPLPFPRACPAGGVLQVHEAPSRWVIVVAGGSDSNGRALSSALGLEIKLDRTTNAWACAQDASWKTLRSMESTRYSPAFCSLDHKTLFVVGGRDAAGQVLDSTEFLRASDVVSGASWHSLSARLSQPRHSGGAAVLDPSEQQPYAVLLAFGGRDPDSVDLDSTEMLCINKDSLLQERAAKRLPYPNPGWCVTEENLRLPRPLSSFGYARMHDTSVVLVGGDAREDVNKLVDALLDDAQAL